MSSPTLSASVAHRLTELLGTDDQFRDLFTSDPMAALRQAGLSETESKDPGFLPIVQGCFRVKSLASKEAIIEARDEINRMLCCGTSQTVPMLDANQSGGRSLK